MTWNCEISIYHNDFTFIVKDPVYASPLKLEKKRGKKEGRNGMKIWEKGIHVSKQLFCNHDIFPYFLHHFYLIPENLTPYSI